MPAITLKKFKDILKTASTEGRTVAEAAQMHGTNAFALMNFLAENKEAAQIFEQYKSKKESSENFTKVVFREITYEKLHNIIAGHFIEEKSVKEHFMYYYPDNDYNNIPQKVKISETHLTKTRYIPPNAEMLAKIISSIGFIKGEKEIAAGTIKAIIETIKAYQANKITQDSFTAIIKSMPIPEDEQLKIISDTIEATNADTPTFEIRTNKHIGWGANAIDEQIENKESEE